MWERRQQNDGNVANRRPVQQQIVDYPLIARAKSTRSFRDLLINFFQALITLLHETDVMYKDVDLVDNLHAWLASMSSSPLRPFRHTATTISLAIQSALVDIASVLDRRIASIEQQLQAAKRGKNKTKADEIQRSLSEATQSRKICNDAIQSFFETVFVHRYRDVDPRIRVECVEALGTWIWNLPTVFLEPGYLRYLGWMLSDTNAGTRQEVLKQLNKLFKRDAEQLGHFIDRFRPRLIEMATVDADVSVRVAAVSVIDSLRAAAILEPNEIDAIGRLIFDSEIRIRKAVVGFFIACVGDVMDVKIDQMGGSDVLEELDLAGDDIYESPRRDWLNLKCLAETLNTYDRQVEEAQRTGGLAVGLDVDLLESTMPETRISLATQVLYDRIPEVKSWQILAGYLLYDHTTSTKSKSRSKKNNPSEDAFKKAVAPNAVEEKILLDVLGSAIKSTLLHLSEQDKSKKRGPRTEAADAQEELALELATNIPKLLSKYGAEPETAAIVLRLERCLQLDSFQQLRQDTSIYEKLLDEVITQFNRHDDKRVLAEAAAALLHARQFEELEELTDSKLSVLWEVVIDSLRSFDTTCELSARGNLDEAPLQELSTILTKISQLASISDCVDYLEIAPSKGDSTSPAIQILVNIVGRGEFDSLEGDKDKLEDEVVTLAIKACQFYFMWKTRNLSNELSSGSGIADEELDSLSILRQTYRKHLITTLSSRASIDQLRLFATGSLCDLHLTFASLRPVVARPSSSASRSGGNEKFKVLVQQIESTLVPELTAIFEGAEKNYAKKAKKDRILNEPAEDEDPVDDEESSDEEDEDETLSKEERLAAELKAEKALCELTAKYVLIITADLIEPKGGQVNKLKRRLQRNATKLGHNFKEVVAYLDLEKMNKRNSNKKSAKTATATTAAPAEKQPQKTALSAEIVHDEDDDDEEEDAFEDAAPEEGTREDLRRRGLLDEDPIEDDEDEEQHDAERQHDEADDDVLGD
jgi:cohesin complex subunit SA-1/2